MARRSTDTRYAIAVQDGSDLRLFMWVKRDGRDVYAFWATKADTGRRSSSIQRVSNKRKKWTPHATHHASGDRHIKGYGPGRILPRRGQAPTAQFVGSEQLITTPISLDVVRRRNKSCVVEEYDGVVRIPAADVDATSSEGRTAIAVDLVAPGAPPLIHPLSAVLQRTVFTDALPHISVTLWDQTQMFAPGRAATPAA